MQLDQIKTEHENIKAFYLEKIITLNAERNNAAAELARIEKNIKDMQTQYILSVEHLLERAEDNN